MPKRNPNKPPPDARPLGEALRRFADPELAAALDAAEAECAAAPAVWPVVCFGGELNNNDKEILRADAARVAAAQAIIDHGWAQLAAGKWIAWGREASPAAPLWRLPAEAWALLVVPMQPGTPFADDVWAGGVVRVKGSDLHYYGVVVCPAAAQLRRPSRAALWAAMTQAAGKKQKPLTQEEAVSIAAELGAPRAQARELHAQMSPAGRRAPRRRKQPPTD